jgi:CRISPR-associated endonuclease/helicase Cas3
VDVGVEVGPDVIDGRPSWVVIAGQRRQLADEEVRQTWSGGRVPVGLTQHQADVAERAKEMASRLELGDRIAEALDTAGALHDEGKRDARFQRLLGRDETAGPDAAPLAKSGRRSPAEYRTAIAASGLPTGWRHEQLSAVVASDRLSADLGAIGLADLVVRLVGTSHGHGRSAFPHATARLVGAANHLVPASRDLHDRGDWDAMVEATHRSHGIWGCAFLEAVLRAADGQVSGEVDERD